MIDNFLNEIKWFLPLKIEVADWKDPILNINGFGWYLNAMTEWRICNSSNLIKGCYDDDSPEYIRNLINLEIVNVNNQLDIPKVDPVFTLSNNLILQIFSTNAIEPWKFRLPNEKIFIASPSDKNWSAKN